MINFYFFSIIVGLVFSVRERLGFYLMLIGCVFFLFMLPPTGLDYEYYKQAFDNAFFIESFPWFTSNTILTSEPLFIWYSSLIGVIFPFNFQFFLAFNFILCLLVSSTFFKFFQNSSYKYYFWLIYLPVIFPTIFYFSPRSSLSFFLILAGFVNLSNSKTSLAYLLLFAGIMLHSQFILITFLILLTYVLFRRCSEDKNFFKIVFCISICLFVFLNFIESFLSILRYILDYLPSGEIAKSKLHMFKETSYEGFRLTGMLSIFVYPVLAYHLLKKIKKSSICLILKNKEFEINFMYLLFAIFCYGAVINIVFITETHIAGRLSRFSDYVGMGLLIPIFLRLYIGNSSTKLVIIFLSIITPLLYGSLYYNINWGF